MEEGDRIPGRKVFESTWAGSPASSSKQQNLDIATRLEHPARLGWNSFREGWT